MTDGLVSIDGPITKVICKKVRVTSGMSSVTIYTKRSHFKGTLHRISRSLKGLRTVFNLRPPCREQQRTITVYWGKTPVDPRKSRKHGTSVRNYKHRKRVSVTDSLGFTRSTVISSCPSVLFRQRVVVETMVS